MLVDGVYLSGRGSPAVLVNMSATPPCVARHLPVITNRIVFLSAKSAPLPIITQRTDFAGMWSFDNEFESQYCSREPSQSPGENFPGDNEIELSSRGESEISDEERNDNTAVKKVPKPQGEPGRPHSGGYALTKVLKSWGDDFKIITVSPVQR